MHLACNPRPTAERRVRSGRALLRPALWLGLGAVAASGCGPLPEVLSPDAPDLPPARLERVSLEGFEGAEQDLRLDAARAEIDPATRMAQLEEVRIDLPARESSERLFVTAPRGEVDLRTDGFRLLGGVVGELGGGGRFETEALRSAPDGQLHSEGPVELHRPNLHLTAAHLRIEPRGRTVHLTGRVRARLRAR